MTARPIQNSIVRSFGEIADAKLTPEKVNTLLKRGWAEKNCPLPPVQLGNVVYGKLWDRRVWGEKAARVAKTKLEGALSIIRKQIEQRASKESGVVRAFFFGDDGEGDGTGSPDELCIKEIAKLSQNQHDSTNFSHLNVNGTDVHVYSFIHRFRSTKGEEPLTIDGLGNKVFYYDNAAELCSKVLSMELIDAKHAKEICETIESHDLVSKLIKCNSCKEKNNQFETLWNSVDFKNDMYRNETNKELAKTEISNLMDGLDGLRRKLGKVSS